MKKVGFICSLLIAIFLSGCGSMTAYDDAVQQTNEIQRTQQAAEQLANESIEQLQDVADEYEVLQFPDAAHQLGDSMNEHLEDLEDDADYF